MLLSCCISDLNFPVTLSPSLSYPLEVTFSLLLYTHKKTERWATHFSLPGELDTSFAITSSPAMLLHMNSHPIWGALPRLVNMHLHHSSRAMPSNSTALCILFPLLSSTGHIVSQSLPLLLATRKQSVGRHASHFPKEFQPLFMSGPLSPLSCPRCNPLILTSFAHRQLRPSLSACFVTNTYIYIVYIHTFRQTNTYRLGMFGMGGQSSPCWGTDDALGWTSPLLQGNHQPPAASEPGCP